MAGKTYTTVQTAMTALEMAEDAKLQYAVNGGNMTFGIAAKMVGATFMATISVATAGSLMKNISSLASDISSLSRVSDISLNTSSQKSADTVSGKNVQYEGVGGCFIAGTKVKIENGEKNIEDVESGDYVLAENPETGEQEYKRVVRTYIHEKTTLVHVFVGEEEIKTTVEHPFYVEGIGFVSAGELRAGDIIRTSDGENLPVDKVDFEQLEEPVLVYNFEVEDFHTYYVSGLGVLVHNMCEKKIDVTSQKYGGRIIDIKRDKKGSLKKDYLFKNKSDAKNFARSILGDSAVRIYEKNGKWIGWENEVGKVYWGHNDWGGGKGKSSFPHLNYEIGNQRGHLFLSDKIKNRGQLQEFLNSDELWRGIEDLVNLH